MTELRRPDPRLCPLCGRENQCAMELERETGQSQPPCWCTQLDFRADLLERIPAAGQGKSCICPACAGASANSQE